MPGWPTFTPMPPRMFLMIFCSKVSSSSCACWAAAATGSISRIPQAQAKNAARRPVDGWFGMEIIRLRPNCRGSATAAPGLAACPLHLRGIGALLRRRAAQGFIQEADHPGNAGGVRQVEYVPGEIEARRGDLE